MKIAIVGSTSKLAIGYLQYTRLPNHLFHCFSRNSTSHPLPNLAKLNYEINALAESNYDVVINFVALADVHKCESNPSLAFSLNSGVVKYLSSLYSSSATHLIHISTDMIYDSSNNKCTPAKEDEVNIPTNMYGFSKYCGESYANQVPLSTVLRTNFYGLFGSNSLYDFFWERFISNSMPVKGYSDIIFSPVSIVTFSQVLDLVIEQKLTGIYNLGSRGSISKLEFALKMKNTMSRYIDISIGISEDRASNEWHRSDFKSRNMSMDSTAIECALDIKLPEVCYDLESYTLSTLGKHLRHS